MSVSKSSAKRGVVLDRSFLHVIFMIHLIHHYWRLPYSFLMIYLLLARYRSRFHIGLCEESRSELGSASLGRKRAELVYCALF